MSDTDKKESLKQYLINRGVDRKDVDTIVDDYTNHFKNKYYELGWRHCRRLNNQTRIFRREKAIQELNEFLDKYSDTLPLQEGGVLDEFINLFYDHLPIIK